MNVDTQRTEGDVNLSSRRTEWQQSNLNEETKQLLDEDSKYFLHQSLSTPCLNTLKGAQGIYIIDGQGRKIMDFHGNSLHQIGYGNPAVINAITSTLHELPFAPRRFTNTKAVALAKKLVEICGGNMAKVLFTPSGTASIGIALKLARYCTGRYKTISMWGAFHGASLDAISIGGEALFRDGLGPLLPGALHVKPYETGEDPILAARRVEELLQMESDVGAVIAEPMRCTTCVPPPAEYWREVKRCCAKYGALLVFDEIPLGLGRVGTWFCYQLLDVEPDILVIGKGLGGAVFPMSACIVTKRLEGVAASKALGHYTHEKSPVGCAAALATVEYIEQQQLLSHVQSLSVYTKTKLLQMKERNPLIYRVEGCGVLFGIELRKPGPEHHKANDEAEQVLYECLTHGLSFKVSDGNVLTLGPPLVITKDEMDTALNIIEKAITRVATTPAPRL